jgi:hypothetical protein
VHTSQRSSGWAITSLISGVVAVLGGFCLLGIPCLVAVGTGHAGLAATRRGRTGGGLAVAGLVLGYVSAVPAAYLFLFGGLQTVLSTPFGP